MNDKPLPLLQNLERPDILRLVASENPTAKPQRMGTQYLIDTNIEIEFPGNTLPTSGSKWLQNIVDHNLHYLSVINQIELLGYNGTTVAAWRFY